ncbi:spermatogenesis-associated serine-rich protein 1 isoform X3 [Phyllostomus discolor]|uniref:Spermatogenesis-associated serine-rich protein 1 isoform X3 n=1 Tax=Phyllostomus discolor TaxID=89673 RepID=A0A7E6DMH1_9CHIR|nr:spermatogenesis-associated serine-rich protein 1 isoform X3 [Phyllostomus discolor]
MSLYTGNGPQGCQSSCITRTTCSREVEKVPEKVDSGMTTVERRYSTKDKDFLESEGCFVNTTSSDQRGSSSCSAGIGGNVSTPPAPCRVSALPDPAADLDLKSSSSHSDHSSETSLSEVQKDKYLEEFSMLKLQTNIDPRNGIPKLTPGDNLYMYPEQSKDFHKIGSTLPPVNFSIVPYEKKFDTFIPLEPPPQIPNLPFWVKEKANRLKNEIREVQELDNWQPATPLLHNLFSTGTLDFPRQL